MATTTKQNTQFCTTAPSIDANKGPWTSISAYTTWLSTEMGLDTPYEGTEIFVKDASSGRLTRYIYEIVNGSATWVEDGSGESTSTADSTLDPSSTNSVQNRAVTNAVSALQVNIDTVEASATEALTAATNATNAASGAESVAQTAATNATNAAASAASAASALASIQSAIEGLDPSTSTDDAITALAAQVASAQTRIDSLDAKITPVLLGSDNTEATDTAKCEAANDEVVALYLDREPESGHRFVLTYLYLQTLDYTWRVSIADYDISEETSTMLVNSCVVADGEVGELTDTDGNVVGLAKFDSNNYTLIANEGEGFSRMPYLLTPCFSKAAQQSLISSTVEAAEQDASDALTRVEALEGDFFPVLLGSDNTAESDTAKCAAANAEVKALHISSTVEENHRLVLSYLYFQTSDSTWYFDITDLNASAGTSTTLVNHGTATDKEVCAVTDTNGNTIGSIFLDSDNYTYIQNAGEGLARMPYLLAPCFDELSQIKLLSSLVGTTSQTATRNAARVAALEGEFFPTLFGSAGSEASDLQKCEYLNAEVKALYLNVQPAEGHRFVFSYLYLQTSDYSWYFNIVDLNVSAGTITAIATNCRADDGVLSDVTDTDGNVIGSILLDRTDYHLIADQGEGYARLPYLLDPCYEYTTQSRLNTSITSERLTSLETKVSKKQITLWGDSITWGSASSANSLCYAARLQTLLGNAGYPHDVINCGVGGDNMPTILGRMGATALYITRDLTIPASAAQSVVVDTVTNYVQVGRYLKASCKTGEQIQLMMQGDLGRSHIDDEEKEWKHTVNPVLVNGVECVWSWNAEVEGNTDEGEYTLAVKETQSSAMTLKAGTPIYPHGARLKSDVAVFAMGTNTGFDDADDYIRMIDLAIEAVNTKHFIVCSPYGGTALSTFGVSGLETLEAALLARYGAKFFNWRKYLVEEGLSVEGLTATATDTSAIAAGEVPPQLLSDVVHPNDYGHDAIARRLYQMMLALGYFD